jgi:hypothetical protein
VLHLRRSDLEVAGVACSTGPRFRYRHGQNPSGDFATNNSRHVSGVQAVWDAETQKRNASPAEIPQSAEPSDSPFVTAPVSFMTFVSRHFRAHAEFQGVVLSR